MEYLTLLFTVFVFIAYIKKSLNENKRKKNNEKILLSTLFLRQKKIKKFIIHLFKYFHSKISTKLNNQIVKQNEQISSLFHQLKNHASYIVQLKNELRKQNKFIENLLKENKNLKSNLEFYTEIDADSTKLNTEYISNFSKDETNELFINKDSLDEEQKYAFNLLEKTNKNLFITGKAGTGKSYLLRKFSKITDKKVLLLAPTGISAINIHGTTLHSTFGYDNLSTLQLEQINEKNIKLKKEKLSLLKSVDIFIIDEISMVRSDIFEKINKILQVIMNDKSPFGGKRFVLFGDLYQLPPIAKKDEIKYMKDKFGSIFFFSSDAYKKGDFEFIELTINHRQKEDKKFFNILNNIRQNNISNSDIDELNKRFCSDVNTLRRVIRLFSKKDSVDRTNDEELAKIPGKEYVYKGIVTFSKNNNISIDNFPISDVLKLKTGALVMMITNDPDKKWVNGTLGIIKKLTEDSIIVVINGREYNVLPVEFKQEEAILKDGKIEYTPVMTIKQYPLVLAYAITIHKSQGMTYQKIACDISDTFTNGQAYVALSRCTSLDGLYLLNKISKTSVFNIDDDVKEFYQKHVIEL